MNIKKYNIYFLIINFSYLIGTNDVHEPSNLNTFNINVIGKCHRHSSVDLYIVQKAQVVMYIYFFI